MAVGILLITHSGIGGALLNVVYGTFGQLPLEIAQLSVSRDPDPELLISQANVMIKKLDAGQGVLVLTDMYGSTPSNIAQSLSSNGYGIRLVTGVNLPMLFRILNYPELSLNELAQKAVISGQDGIFEPVSSRLMHIPSKVKTTKKQSTAVSTSAVVILD